MIQLVDITLKTATSRMAWYSFLYLEHSFLILTITEQP